MSPSSHERDGVPIRSQYANDPEMAELVEFFVSELPQRTQAIEAAMAESRAADLKRLAHQLKGAGGGYGYPAISSAAARVEEDVKQAGDRMLSELDQLRGDVEALLAICERAIAGCR
ncbi:MAG: Hpt domain-containing protein [Phycisphaerales bacterium]|jgi:HPt (histidine-containing phosphotransfer) domain-containing protein|nr:Hpt domain-containing protein [Phycisphaerales bacterium]